MIVMWRKIQNIQGNCEVNNLGMIRWKKGDSYIFSVGIKHSSGYMYFKGKRVHRLVLEAFVGKSDLVIDHINGIKSDNRLENLEYVTQKENINRGLKTRPVSERKRGSYKHFEPVPLTRKCDNEMCNKEYTVNANNFKRGHGKCCCKSCAATVREKVKGSKVL